MAHKYKNIKAPYDPMTQAARNIGLERQALQQIMNRFAIRKPKPDID